MTRARPSRHTLEGCTLPITLAILSMGVLVGLLVYLFTCIGVCE